MKHILVLTAMAATLSTPILAHAASLELRNIYANLNVIPEDRADIVVDIKAPDGRLPRPVVSRSGANVMVDGGLNPVHGCSGLHPEHGIDAAGHGWLSHNSALTITVHTPRAVKIRANGAILGDVREAQSLDLDTDGCTRWRIGDVSGPLSIRQEGAAAITAGAAGATDLDLSGLTHVDLVSARSLKVDMSGAGKVQLGSVSGAIDSDLSGLGSVAIASGRADHVRAEVSGMGGFKLHGSARDLDAEVSGVGSVHVDHVEGAVHRSVSGIGHVSVGG
jgi:hypothetical protein